MSVVAPDLAKFLEDLCLVLRRDPDAGVTDRYLYRTISLPGVNSNPSSLRGELHCVGKQVEKNLFYLSLIADEVAKPLVNCNVKVDAVLGGALRTKVRALSMAKGRSNVASSNSIRPASTLERSRISLIREGDGDQR